MDREILKRLAGWCRWLETEWDRLENRRWIRIQSADLMEFLTQYYRITGLKAVLRLCSRLRSSSMDWTTVLHHFHQRNPLVQATMESETEKLFAREDYGEIDFYSAQFLTNHGELLADGLRYTARSAQFSGNGQEIAAGQKGWEYLKKNHGAACGGTTADLFLCGRGTDRGIHTVSTAAWAEAMIAQAQLHADPWVLNELVRIVYNALADCLNHPETVCHAVNTRDANTRPAFFDPEKDPERETRILARLGRAAAMVWQNAVGTNSEGIRVNYLLPGRYTVCAGGQNAVLLADRDTLYIRCRNPFDMNISLFCAGTETAEMILQGRDGGEKRLPADDMADRGGGTLKIRRTWENLDSLRFHQGEKIHTEETHHRGVCIMVRNRLMALDTRDAEYRYAVHGAPFMRNGQVFVPVQRITRWPLREGIPADIPVLPAGNGEPVSAPLTPYAETPGRIAVFPREAGDA